VKGRPNEGSLGRRRVRRRDIETGFRRGASIAYWIRRRSSSRTRDTTGNNIESASSTKTCPKLSLGSTRHPATDSTVIFARLSFHHHVHVLFSTLPVKIMSESNFIWYLFTSIVHDFTTFDISIKQDILEIN
jgi:hypothetical protein